MTPGQARCLTNDSLRAAYWDAKRAYDAGRGPWADVATTTAELVSRRLRP
jgi:hypothetical protein